MYSRNPLSKNVLITPDEVTFLFNRQVIDGNIWKSAIQIAEERFVRPVLGSAFYDSLCAQKNITVTTGNITQLQGFFDAEWGPGKITLELGDCVNAIELISVTAQNATLWNNYLWKFIYEAVYFTALPEVYAQFSNAGVIKNNPSPTFLDGNTQGGTSSGIGLNDLKYLKDDVLLQRISVMQDALERYLCENAASFPLYPKKNHIWDEHGRRQSSRKTGFIDIYSEDCDDERTYIAPSQNVAPAPSYRACSMQLQIKTTPNPSNAYTLCNLTTIALEYPEGMTLTVPHLIGKTITYPIYVGNNPISVMPFDILTGTLDNTANGGFSSDPSANTITINYNEVV